MRQAMLASICVLAVFGAAFLFASPKSPLRTTLPVEAGGDAELYTGTIQLAPSRTNLCRRMSFDNRSGEMRDKGMARCAATLAESGNEPERYWRRNIDRVREGFVNR